MGGASSNLGHPIEYRFDWGDGNISYWFNPGKDLIPAHRLMPGKYEIRVQARCAIHNEVESEWSDALKLDIEGRTKKLVPIFAALFGVGLAILIGTFGFLRWQYAKNKKSETQEGRPPGAEPKEEP